MGDKYGNSPGFVQGIRDREIVEDEFYAPHEIHFTVSQIVWLLKNLSLLKDGRWPPGDSDDILTRKGIKGRSYFEIPAVISAEVEIRLKRLGDDGFIIRDRFCHDEDVRTLSRKYHLFIEDVKSRISRGLRYMSGEARKQISYKEFTNHRKSHSKANSDKRKARLTS